MELFDPSLSFKDIVDKAIYNSDLSKALSFLSLHPEKCTSDSLSLQRFLNELKNQDMAEDIARAFSVLLKHGFIFDQREYLSPLKEIIECESIHLAMRVLIQLINNQVTIDIGIIQKAFECCFVIIEKNPKTTQDLLENLKFIQNMILVDTSKFVSQEFVLFIVDRYIDINMQH